MAPRRAVALVALATTASVSGWWLARTTHELTAATVTNAVDGDTLEVQYAGRRDTVRLLGVDTPETVHPDRPVECFGPEASAFTHAQLDGRPVTLEFDAERRDPYGRLLAFVIVDGRRFNDELLRRGYARLLVIAPNGRHGRDLLEAELEARREGRGLWGRCPGSP